MPISQLNQVTAVNLEDPANQRCTQVHIRPFHAHSRLSLLLQRVLTGTCRSLWLGAAVILCACHPSDETSQMNNRSNVSASANLSINLGENHLSIPRAYVAAAVRPNPENWRALRRFQADELVLHVHWPTMQPVGAARSDGAEVSSYPRTITVLMHGHIGGSEDAGVSGTTLENIAGKQWTDKQHLTELGLMRYFRDTGGRAGGAWGDLTYVPLDENEDLRKDAGAIRCTYLPAKQIEPLKCAVGYYAQPHLYVSYSYYGALLPNWKSIHSNVVRLISDFARNQQS
jgi:hypothetical protein